MTGVVIVKPEGKTPILSPTRTLNLRGLNKAIRKTGIGPIKVRQF